MKSPRSPSSSVHGEGLRGRSRVLSCCRSRCTSGTHQSSSLLSRHTGNTVSRVRIPPSPPNLILDGLRHAFARGNPRRRPPCLGENGRCTPASEAVHRPSTDPGTQASRRRATPGDRTGGDARAEGAHLARVIAGRYRASRPVRDRPPGRRFSSPDRDPPRSVRRSDRDGILLRPASPRAFPGGRDGVRRRIPAPSAASVSSPRHGWTSGRGDLQRRRVASMRTLPCRRGAGSRGRPRRTSPARRGPRRPSRGRRRGRR